MHGFDRIGLKTVHARFRPRPAGRGFTIVELVVVLILIGIVGAFAAAKFSDRTSFDAAGFADRSKALLRFAQEEAIAQHRPVHAYFDGNAARLCYASGASCASGNFVLAPFTVQTDSICTASNWYCIRRPSNVSVSLSGEIAFDQLGRPTDASGNALTSAVTVTIAAGSNSVPITIEAETGYVH